MPSRKTGSTPRSSTSRSARSTGANSEDRLVCWSTAKLIQRARVDSPRYAGHAVGTSTCDMAKLLAAHRTRIRYHQYEAATALALPYRGGHLIGMDRLRKRSDDIFNVRHELGHVVAGEVQEALTLTAEDTMSFAERRADLFAVADLTPTPWMDRLKGKRRPWRQVTLEVAQAFRCLAPDWSARRVMDRARLRVELYREFGI